MAQNVDPVYQAQSQSGKESENALRPQSDSHAVTKRLTKDLMTLMNSADKSITAFPDGDNIFNWIGTITGPKDSVYEKLKFKLTLNFSNSYPYTPPTVKFLTPCFHPNVDTSGNICVDILKETWSAMYDTKSILVSIQSLLGEPNVNSPLNAMAAEMWPNKDEYKKHVMETYKEL